MRKRTQLALITFTLATAALMIWGGNRSLKPPAYPREARPALVGQICPVRILVGESHAIAITVPQVDKAALAQLAADFICPDHPPPHTPYPGMWPNSYMRDQFVKHQRLSARKLVDASGRNIRASGVLFE